MKAIKYTLLLTIAVLAFILIGGLIALDNVAHNVIEKKVSQALGTEVTIEKVNLSLLNRELEIKNLVVKNPKNFKKPEAFQAGRIRITFYLSTLFSDNIPLKEVALLDNKLNYEFNPLNKAHNLKVLYKNSRKQEKRLKLKERDPSSKSVKHVTIKELKIKNTEVIAYASGVEVARARMPEITLRNLGKRNSGVNYAVVIKKILERVMKEVNLSNIEPFWGGNGFRKKLKRKFDIRKIPKDKIIKGLFE